MSVLIRPGETGRFPQSHHRIARNRTEIHSKYLGDLGVPSLPGGFLDVLSYFGRGGSGNNLAGVPIPGIPEVKQEPDESRSTTAGAAAAAPLAVSGPSNAASIGMTRTGSAKGKGKDVPTGVSTLGNVSRM